MRDEDRDAGPDVSADEELAAEMEVVARIQNAEKSEPWDVYDVRSNSSGVYYVINVKSTGGLIVPVTVKHSTRYDTMVCLTCMTNDRCRHSKFVRSYARSHAA